MIVRLAIRAHRASSPGALRFVVDLLLHVLHKSRIVDFFVAHAVNAPGMIGHLNKHILIAFSNDDGIAIGTHVPAAEFPGHPVLLSIAV